MTEISNGITLSLKSTENKAYDLIVILNIMDSRISQHENMLAQETSPYLLQHAQNPVNWYAWNPATLEKARLDDKVILVSIGYSSCHWCHVMAHESFQDETIAGIMNENFICIKVDREERPDVDQVYMDSLHAIGRQGGWPLNCFALPDGKPFWGGTYFLKEQWKSILEQVVELFKTQRKQIEKQAHEIAEGIGQNEMIDLVHDDNLNPGLPEDMFRAFSLRFDFRYGGNRGAPKFPMPNNLLFLLRYNALNHNAEIIDHINLSLSKMASGGIYDQIGGGFARYSVDEQWHIPHFEKMLYDNAQLVSLYSEAFRLTKNDFYKQVIVETLDFVAREFTSENGGFYSALDADSEGEEGKYYVWEKNEIISLVDSDELEIALEYFGIDQHAEWENGQNVLIRNMSYSDLAKKFQKSIAETEKIISNVKRKLLTKRSERVTPGLDDKILTSWNGLMLKGYVDAYLASGNNDYLEAAIRNAGFILDKLKKPDGSLHHCHTKNHSYISGFLDDYAFTIEAFLSLYQATFNKKWAEEARELMEFVIEYFNDEHSGLLFFTPKGNSDLFTRKIELIDQVIPSANSSIAGSLLILGHLLENEGYRQKSWNMLLKVRESMRKYPTGFSNWGILALNMIYPFYTVAICGEEAFKVASEFRMYDVPNTMIAASLNDKNLPIFQGRFIKGKTKIHVCRAQECLVPVETAEQALTLILNDKSNKRHNL